jgi:hypothetical protein
MRRANADAESYMRQFKANLEIEALLKERDRDLSLAAQAIPPGWKQKSIKDVGGKLTTEWGPPEELGGPKQNLDTGNPFKDPVSGEFYVLDKDTGKPVSLGKLAPYESPKNGPAPQLVTGKNGIKYQVVGGVGSPVTVGGQPLEVQTSESPEAIMARALQQQSMMMSLQEELRAVDDLGLPDVSRREAARRQLQELYKSVNPQLVNQRGFNAADFAAAGTAPTNSVQPTNIMTNRPPLSAFQR